MNSRNLTTQSGAALVVSLVILISITLLGVTTMKQSFSELAMAGNLRQAETAFQAAEVALSKAEKGLETSDPINLIGETDADPDYLVDETWTTANTTEVDDVSLANISVNPRYIVKSLGTWDPNANVTKGDPGFGGYGQTSTAVKVTYFKVTSRGYGQNGTTARTLQTFFGRSFND
jgi:type IV pilus assembly protein PilX